ncbi:MAG: SDR family oxidoreductase [Pseudobdellovibrionaceae bacterium]
MSESASSKPKKTIFCFGFGYTCVHLANFLKSSEAADINWVVKGTTRDPEKKDYYKERDVRLFVHDTLSPLPELVSILQGVTHILISAPPDKEGCPVFRAYAKDIVELADAEWIGYLSTTGVYGDRGGAQVDETAEIRPSTIRGSRRELAEQQWLSLFEKHNMPVQVFRLAGIYGPGRSAIESVTAGIARRIYKEGHVFNRVHVGDIVNIVYETMMNPRPGEIYNVSDDEPAPSHEVIGYACELLDIAPPPVVAIENANLAPITMSFYSDNKRVINKKVKADLGIELIYPTYREGLKNCLEVMRTQEAASKKA